MPAPKLCAVRKLTDRLLLSQSYRSRIIVDCCIAVAAAGFHVCGFLCMDTGDVTAADTANDVHLHWHHGGGDSRWAFKRTND